MRAQIRRYHNLAAFESILRHYHISDPTLTLLGKIIHDIEVNTWQRKKFEETLIIQQDINQIIDNSNSGDEVVEKSLHYFDSVYQRLKKNSLN